MIVILAKSPYLSIAQYYFLNLSQMLQEGPGLVKLSTPCTCSRHPESWIKIWFFLTIFCAINILTALLSTL